jgi:deoxyribodipyrimidine photolyase-related protein
MKEITLIFPDQLFEKHPALNFHRTVYLAEDYLFFRVQPFHKKKLVLLRAAMQSYANFLRENGYEVVYIETSVLKKRGDLFSLIAKKGVNQIYLADFADDWQKQDIEKAAKEANWKLHFSPSPMFLCNEEELKLFFKNKNRLYMAPFYAYQRKKLNILMEDGKPVGGKFSFDMENRKRLLKNCTIPKLYIPKKNALISEAIDDIEKHIPETIGEVETFIYPTNFDEAKKALLDFIQNRLFYFGDYEDAIKENESFVFHSVLSPSINIGLLTPKDVIETILTISQNLNIPLNSLEGFIRQIIGWREFMRASYILQGRAQRTSNYFEHKRSLPKGFWDGTTGILPVDSTIKRILKTGYCHHIERLMVLGNFLLLTETDPNFVYEWFMGYFVDAYDWVMVPNVYGMSQYSDRGGNVTKPYISGANYILKMSDYSKKGDWVDIWDGLFWRFLSKHKILFESNPRSKVLLGMLIKNKATIQPKMDLAEKWLSNNR